MKKIIKKIFALSLISFILFVALPMASFAAVQENPELKPEFAADIINRAGSRANAVNIILQLIAGSLIYAAGPLAVLMIAWGGSSYVTSHGDQTKMEAAKKTIMWAIFGLLIIVVSYAIVTNIIVIISTTGHVGTEAAT